MTFSPFEVDIDLVIWDFDGTILDTEWPAFQSATREFERFGRQINMEIWSQSLGSAGYELWWKQLQREVGGFGESDEAFLARYRSRKNELTDKNHLLPGVSGLMTAFEARGLAAAVASSSPRYWVDRHLPRLGLVDRLPVIITRDDVGADRTKPHPDLFLRAAERSGIDPARCLVIEDTNHGVAAAKAAGMYAIAVPHRLTKAQDFTAADRVVDSLEELLP